MPCAGGYPWDSHCATCKSGCGECRVGDRKPLFVKVPVSRQVGVLEEPETWHGWERVA